MRGQVVLIENVRDLFAVIEVLDLPKDDLLVTGSAPLLVHGLRSAIHDLDLVARGLAWEKALAKNPPTLAPFDKARKVEIRVLGTSVEILDRWFPIQFGWTVEFLLASAEVVEGIRFMPLRQTLMWKSHLQRSKDMGDIEAIRKYLSIDAI